MSEAHIGFLFNASTIIAQTENNESHQKLKSYYLMKCKEITRGYGLPKQHFSENIRCSYCCIEWNNKTVTKLKSRKLTKQQRRRIRSKSGIKDPCNKKYLLYGNEIEKTCSFCNKSINIPLLKPTKSCKEIVDKNNEVSKQPTKQRNKKIKPQYKQDLQSNVYCKSKIAFSLKKKKNTLLSTVKETPKMIKNSKKKKDKYAGLCQKAVVAATKLKKEKAKENKINLFLKPSL